MWLAGIVVHLDVVNYISCGLFLAMVATTAHPVRFESGEEALHHSVIIWIALAAHAAGDFVSGKKLLKNKTGILRALVRMKYSGRRRQSAISRAPIASRAVMRRLGGQPTTRRENRSRTTAR